MIYRAVHDLCAVSIEPMRLQQSPDGELITSEKAIEVLCSAPLNFELVHRGFSKKNLELLSQLVGQSTYLRGVEMKLAPNAIDCSGLAKWFYGQLGIWLPKRSIQQAEAGINVVQEQSFWCGDLILSESTSGRNYFDRNPSMGIGHVGIATGRGTMFHATKQTGVIEADIIEAFGSRCERLRTVRRLIPNPNDFYVFRSDPRWGVETSDDIMWLIRENL